jgi:hypothetical protein
MEGASMSRQDYVLAVLRATCIRVRLIETELHTIGVALKGNLISPEMALECAQEIAPGCAAVVAETAMEAA